MKERGKQTTISIRIWEKMQKTVTESWRPEDKLLSGQRPTVVPKDLTRWRQAADAE